MLVSIDPSRSSSFSRFQTHKHHVFFQVVYQSSRLFSQDSHDDSIIVWSKKNHPSIDGLLRDDRWVRVNTLYRHQMSIWVVNHSKHRIQVSFKVSSGMDSFVSVNYTLRFWTSRISDYLLTHQEISEVAFKVVLLDWAFLNHQSQTPFQRYRRQKTETTWKSWSF